MTDVVTIALERQGATFSAPIPDVVLSFAPACRAQAIAYAMQMRRRGVSVAILYGMNAEALRHRLCENKARAAVYITPDGLTQYGKAVL